MSKVTLRTIGQRLDISAMTVSKALRGSSDISETTRERVLAEARRLNYVPNLLARNLTRKRTKTVGFLFPDLRFDFAHRIVTGAKSVLGVHGYTCVIGLTSWNAEDERQELEMMLGQQVDAIICQPLTGSEEVYRSFARYGAKLIFVGNRLNVDGASWIAMDGEYAATTITNYLLGLGHRRIAIIVPDSVDRAAALRPRLEAYSKCLRSHGVGVDESLIIRHPTGHTASIIEGAARLMSLPSPPTAILGITDVIAFYVIEYLLKAGYRVPADVSVAGIDGCEVSRLEAVSLTTVVSEFEYMGRLAGEAALGSIDGTGKNSDRQLVRGTLQVGKTAGPLIER